MRFMRPKSLSTLMLLGLALIAVPLVVAVIDAAVQMRRLASSSQGLVEAGVRTTRHSQDMFVAITDLERNARLYQVLGDAKDIDAYRRNDARLSSSIEQLRAQLRDTAGAAKLAEVDALRRAAARAITTVPPGAADVPEVLTLLDRMAVAASNVAALGNRQIDNEVAALQAQSVRARRRLFWQSALLAPLTLVAILAVTLSIGRPLRQIDRVIGELGRGSFTQPVAVTGPVDLERLGRQLEWLRVRLLELAQERNRFLRHLSHELKTPLANIREGTELLMDGAVGELGTGQREVTTILRENGIKLQRLIENLLSFSAWQTQSVGLDVSEFRIRPLIKQVLESQQLTMLSQRVRLDVKVDDVTLLADRGKVRLMLENLLSNAIKYSPKGGAIVVRASASDSEFVLDVADSGPGVPAEDREHIFDAFYTGKAAQSGHLKGTGIGLSVVMEFVAAHTGTIEIIDGEYPGAHFRIRMPLRSTATALQRSAEHAHAA